MTINIRNAIIEDLPRIVEIYNSTVDSRMVTADTSPVTVESRTEWFLNHSQQRPIFLFLKNDKVAGWFSFETFYGRSAYRGMGLGKYAVNEIKRVAKTLNIQTLLAFTFSHNKPAIQLFLNEDFSIYGEIPEIAEMDGKRYSLSILGFKI